MLRIKSRDVDGFRCDEKKLIDHHSDFGREIHKREVGQPWPGERWLALGLQKDFIKDIRFLFIKDRSIVAIVVWKMLTKHFARTERGTILS